MVSPNLATVLSGRPSVIAKPAPGALLVGVGLCQPNSQRVVLASWSLAALLLLCGAILLYSAPRLALVVSATLLGWTQMRNMCGLSHLGTLTPLAVRRWIWVKVVAAYVAGGLVTSTAVWG